MFETKILFFWYSKEKIAVKNGNYCLKKANCYASSNFKTNIGNKKATSE